MRARTLRIVLFATLLATACGKDADPSSPPVANGGLSGSSGQATAARGGTNDAAGGRAAGGRNSGGHAGERQSGGDGGGGDGGATNGGTPNGGTTNGGTSPGEGGSGAGELASGYYTDLASAPVGAFITAYGSGFGSSGTVTLGGASQAVLSYADDKVVFTASGAGGELVVGGHSLGTFVIHTGRVREATPASFSSEWAKVEPGDVLYLRAGTYAEVYGEGDWYQDCTLETYRQGSAAQPIALVGYPGETVVWHNAGRHSPICLGDANSSGRRAAWLTFAGFDITADTTCIDFGGDTTDPEGGPDETGATNIRVVGLRCEITDTSQNTETGMISIQGDGARILGNRFINDPAREVINNNHGIYIQNGADDVEVAYNIMDGLRMGHVLQVHQDGVPKLYERISLHDNHFEGRAYGDMRGISVVNVADASSVEIARNTFRHQGQDGWGCINIYRGHVTVDSNDCRDSEGGINLNGGYEGTRSVTLTGNAICPLSGYPAIGVENGASESDYTLSDPLACD